MTNASWGGIGSGNFVSNSSVSGDGGAGGRTLVDTVVTDAMMQAGTILAVKYRGTSSLFASVNGCRFAVYRKNGTNFDFVGASETFTMDVTGSTVTKTLGTPITGVQVGDYCAVWLENGQGGGGAGGVDNSLTVTAGGSLKFLNGAMPTGTNINFSGGPLVDTLNLEFFGAQPLAGMTGDSIEVGHGGTFTSFFDGTGPAVGADGTPACELGYNMKPLIGATWNYQDFAEGSQTFDFVRHTGIPAILAGTGTHASIACGATEIWIHCGVNDVAGARSWATVSADLDAIYAAVGTVPLFIDEILPDTNFSDVNAATVRTFNTNLHTWASAKATVAIVTCHDAMGQNRVSTGFSDDLKSSYNSGDGVHINSTGAAALAAIRVAARAAYFATNTNITPSAGALVFAGVAPSIIQAISRTPTAGALSLTGATPTVSQALGSQSITPGAGALTFAGASPIMPVFTLPMVTSSGGEGPVTVSGGMD